MKPRLFKSGDKWCCHAPGCWAWADSPEGAYEFFAEIYEPPRPWYELPGEDE